MGRGEGFNFSLFENFYNEEKECAHFYVNYN